MRFAPEHELLDRVMQTYGLEPIVANFEQAGGLQSVRDFALGTQAKLSEHLSPRLVNLLNEVQSALHYHGSVNLFVAAEPTINAWAIYSLHDKPHILSVTSALIERMNDTELRFVLGHEIGHIHFQHYRARSAVQAIGQDSEGNSHIPPLLRRRLGRNRLTELSADRAAYPAASGDFMQSFQPSSRCQPAWGQNT